MRLAKIAFAAFCGVACVSLSGCASPVGKAPFVSISQLNEIGNQDYRIDRGDVINVVFRNTSELNDAVLVRPDGKVSLAYIHDVPAAGRTLDEFREQLAKSYEGILRDPRIDLSVRSSANSQVYVGGEVTNPGMFGLAGHGTLSQYLTMAGNTKVTAARSRIILIRRDAQFHPVYAVIDGSRLYSGDAGSDIVLRPYDVVYVRKNLGGKLDGLAEVYIRNLIPTNFTLSYFIP